MKHISSSEMKCNSEDEDFVKSSQPIRKNNKFSIQRLLNGKSPAKSPKKLVRTPKNPILTPRNLNDFKNQMQSNVAVESTPQKLVSDNISVHSGSNFVTPSPSKIKSEFDDTSYLGGFEVVNMHHDLNDVLNWDSMKFPSDSTMDYTNPDVIRRVLDSELELEIDPLSIENSNENGNKAEEKISQSPCKKSLNKSSPRKSDKKGKVSFAKKQPKSKYVPKKSKEKSESPESSDTEDFSFSEENTDGEIESILEEVYHVEKEEILSSRTIEKLQDLEVRLTHKVPPQHKVEKNAGSRPPTQQQKRVFERYNRIIKGRFSEEEDNLIRKNWKSFCKIHQWDEENIQPFLYMRHQGKCYISNFTERQKFVQFLANGLPCRTLYSVYYRFRNLFGKKFHETKGRFSKEEDKKIRLYMKGVTDSNKKFAELAKILGRTRQSIWSRYQLLTKTSKSKIRKKEKSCMTNVTWNVTLIKEFLEQLMDATLSENVKELKNAIIPKVVWEEMESRMHIAQNVLKIFWTRQLHIQLFSPIPVYMTDVKIKLIELLYKSGISHPKEINWTDVCSLFDGMTTAFLCRVFYGLLKHVSRKNISKNFFEIVEYLHSVMIPSLKEQSKDRFLPRLSFEDGTVRILDEECKKGEVRRRSERLRNSFSTNEIERTDNSNVTWTLPMREKFLNTLLAVTLCRHVKELKDAIIPRVVWEEMAERMAVDENKIINFWYNELHIQLFSPIPIYMTDVKIKLIELIYKEQIKEIKHINWVKLCKYFDGMTTFFIAQVFLSLVKSAREDINSDNFCDIMEYLHKTMVPKINNQSTDKYLPRLTFRNKTLSIVEEFQEKIIFKEERISSSSSTSDMEVESDMLLSS